MAQENLGGAVVLNNYFGGITNAFNRNQQIAQKKQQDEQAEMKSNNKELEGIMKDLKTDGIRDADVGILKEKVNKIYDSYYTAFKSKDRNAMLDAKIKLQQNIKDANEFTLKSKDTEARYGKIATTLADPKNYGLYSQTQIEDVKKLKGMSSDKIDASKLDPMAYMSSDFSYSNNKIKDIAKQIFTTGTNTVISDNSRKVTRGNKNINIYTETKQLDAETLGKNLIMAYNANDPKFKNQVDAQIRAIGIQITPQDYLATLAVSEAKNYKTTTEKQLADNKVTINTGSGDKVTADSYRQQTVSGLLQKDEDTLGRVKAQMLPTAEINWYTDKRGTSAVRIKTPEGAKGTGGDVVFINPNQPNAATQLNTYLSIITGEKVSGSKFGTVGAKPTGKLSEPQIRAKAEQVRKTKSTPTKSKDSKFAGVPKGGF